MNNFLILYLPIVVPIVVTVGGLVFLIWLIKKIIAIERYLKEIIKKM